MLKVPNVLTKRLRHADGIEAKKLTALLMAWRMMTDQERKQTEQLL